MVSKITSFLTLIGQYLYISCINLSNEPILNSLDVVTTYHTGIVYIIVDIFIWKTMYFEKSDAFTVKTYETYSH